MEGLQGLRQLKPHQRWPVDSKELMNLGVNFSDSTWSGRTGLSLAQVVEWCTECKRLVCAWTWVHWQWMKAHAEGSEISGANAGNWAHQNRWNPVVDMKQLDRCVFGISCRMSVIRAWTVRKA